MTLEVSRVLTSNTRFHYLCTILCGKTLHKFKTFCVQVGKTTMTHLNQTVLDLGIYFFLFNTLSKQKHLMPME